MWVGPDTLVLVIAVAAFGFGGIVKGVMGFGLPMLAIPALTAAHSLPMALSIAVIPVVATNIWQLWTFRAARAQTPFLPGFLVVGAIGLVVGVFALSWIEDAYLEVALGGLVITYLLLRLRDRGEDRPRWAKAGLAPVAGGLAGAVHGATGLSGLVGTPYLHALSLPRPGFVFANGAMFTLFSAMQAPTLWALGLYRTEAIWMGLLTLPSVFLGLWLGGKFGAKLKSESFSHAVLVILALAAIIPVWNGLKELLAI